MKMYTKEFLRLALVPIVILATFLVFLSIYRILDLPSPAQFIELAKEYYARYGYLVVFVGAFAEGLLFVNWYLPGSAVAVLGVVFAKENDLSATLVVLTITAAFFLTTILNYGMGRFGWYHVFMKLGLREPLTRARERVERRGLALIFTTYFHPNIGALTATSAGILHLSFRKFIRYSAMALLAWNTLWGTITYFAGPAILRLLNAWTIVTALVIWIIFLGVRFYWKQKALKERV